MSNARKSKRAKASRRARRAAQSTAPVAAAEQQPSPAADETPESATDDVEVTAPADASAEPEASVEAAAEATSGDEVLDESADAVGDVDDQGPTEPGPDAKSDDADPVVADPEPDDADDANAESHVDEEAPESDVTESDVTDADEAQVDQAEEAQEVEPTPPGDQSVPGDPVEEPATEPGVVDEPEDEAEAEARVDEPGTEDEPETEDKATPAPTETDIASDGESEAEPAGESEVESSGETGAADDPTSAADDPTEPEVSAEDSEPDLSPEESEVAAAESAAADGPGSEPATSPESAEDTPAPVDSHRSWRRLGRAARPRPTKANVLATVLALGLGFAIAAQVRQTSIEGLEDLREDELIRILDTVNQDGNRLADELQTLRFSRDRLKNDTTSLTEQRNAAQQRLDSLGILAGTVPAQGPGIILTINDPQNRVTAPLLLDTLQELRDAGAEAIEINGVRIVANSFFTDGEGGIEISGTPVTGPYVVRAIGDPATLAPAMDIPGGVSESVRAIDGQARIDSRDEVKVTALRSVSEPQYARPVPSPSKS